MAVAGFLPVSFDDDKILRTFTFSVRIMFCDLGRSINPGFPDFFLLNTF